MFETIKEMGLRLSRALMPYGMVVFSAVNGGQSKPHVQPSLRAVEYSSGVSQEADGSDALLVVKSIDWEEDQNGGYVVIKYTLHLMTLFFTGEINGCQDE